MLKVANCTQDIVVFNKVHLIATQLHADALFKAVSQNCGVKFSDCSGRQIGSQRPYHW